MDNSKIKYNLSKYNFPQKGSLLCRAFFHKENRMKKIFIYIFIACYVLFVPLLSYYIYPTFHIYCRWLGWFLFLVLISLYILRKHFAPFLYYLYSLQNKKNQIEFEQLQKQFQELQSQIQKNQITLTEAIDLGDQILDTHLLLETHKTVVQNHQVILKRRNFIPPLSLCCTFFQYCLYAVCYWLCIFSPKNTLIDQMICISVLGVLGACSIYIYYEKKFKKQTRSIYWFTMFMCLSIVFIGINIVLHVYY